jgi:hypothetical protein
MKTRERYWSLLLGIITVFAVVLSQLCHYQPVVQENQQIVAVDQPEDEGTTQESSTTYHLSVTTTFLPSSATFEINHQAFCLFKIFEDHQPDEEIHDTPFQVSKLFRTMFRSIISPNAP